MKCAKGRLFILALAANALVMSSGMGLTIYRIGDQDLSPPPQGVDLVQLSWEGSISGHGRSVGWAHSRGRAHCSHTGPAR